MLEKLNAFKPSYMGVGNLRVDQVVADAEAGVVAVYCNEAVSYLPMTSALLEDLKAELSSVLPEECKDYQIKVISGDRDLDVLTAAATRKIVAPTETGRFITPKDWTGAPLGLDGKNIAMWQSHGYYFEPKLNRWEWQRARTFQTVEDLYTQSYVIPFLMPMLENAGACVFNPRERDVNSNEVIVDGDGGFAQNGYEESVGAQAWSDAPVAGFGYEKAILANGDNPFRMGKVRQVATVSDPGQVSSAKWSASLPADGSYAVYVSYATLPNSATDALYRINSLSGTREILVNQKMGGGTWIYLGHYHFKAGKASLPVVELLNLSSDEGAVVTADAVKIGGGMGNVARIVKDGEEDLDYQYVTSGYPRYTEGARYWLQWAGMPDTVYTPSDNVNDYTDDYRCRGVWVNYLAGGSSMLPDYGGLNIPMDLSFAFHSDAGTTMNDSIIGTLGIYFTANGADYLNGTSRYASRDLTNTVQSTILEDIHALYEPNWTRRGLRDASYFEARVPEVPAMLLELLSHQNLADMKYGLDPTFRFTVSRAVYKGMLKFLAARDNRPYVVQPLPVRGFEIKNSADGKYLLSWKETVDSLEPTAKPAFYLVQERLDDAWFSTIAKVEEPRFEVSVTDNDIHSYRIIAGNDGGVSYPSEILALCDLGNDNPQVLVVNGFTRVSGPDTFDSGKLAGLNDLSDHGVPYINDINYIGSQFEFRRELPWRDDDAAGFGTSRSEYEDKVIAGNTFDFVYNHGKAIVDAGHSFISTSVEAFCGSDEKAPIVDLILGKQKEIIVGTGAYGTRYKAFPVELQQRITDLCNSGTDMFITGAYVATDMWDNPFSDEETAAADQKFATDVLGYKWMLGMAAIKGEAYTVSTRFKTFPQNKLYNYNATLNEDRYIVESPDGFYPSDDSKGVTLFRYKENNISAGVAVDNGAYRTVVLGFPFESIVEPDQQSALMGQVLRFFKEKPSTNDAAKKGDSKNSKNKKKK